MKKYIISEEDLIEIISRWNPLYEQIKPEHRKNIHESAKEVISILEKRKVIKGLK